MAQTKCAYIVPLENIFWQNSCIYSIVIELSVGGYEIK